MLVNCDFNALDGQEPYMNGLKPDKMIPAERLAELGRLLAFALIRMRAGKSSSLSAAQSQRVVDLAPAKSGGHRRKPHNRVGG